MVTARSGDLRRAGGRETCAERAVRGSRCARVSDPARLPTEGLLGARAAVAGPGTYGRWLWRGRETCAERERGVDRSVAHDVREGQRSVQSVPGNAHFLETQRAVPRDA
jgi:hypothetical protein